MFRMEMLIHADIFLVGSVVEWLKCRAYDQHGAGLKPTCSILLCTWERLFTALSLAFCLGKQF